MKTIGRIVSSTMAIAVLVGATGCSGWDTRDRNTAIGAGVGALGGSVLTDGSTLGTVGGAVVGGAVGRNVNK